MCNVQQLYFNRIGMIGMFKSMIKNILLIVMYGLAFLGLGYVIAIIISKQFGYVIQDVLFIEGLLVIILGFLLSMKGNPSGSSLQGLGRNNAQQLSYLNMEVTKTEREATSYHKNFLKHSIVEFAFSNFTIILGGVFILVFSMLISR